MKFGELKELKELKTILLKVTMAEKPMSTTLIIPITPNNPATPNTR